MSTSPVPGLPEPSAEETPSTEIQSKEANTAPAVEGEPEQPNAQQKAVQDMLGTAFF